MKNTFLLIVVLLFVACGNDEEKQMILGDWEVKTWVRQADGETIGNQMDFHFNQDGRYAVNYGYRTERGKFWFAEGGLITQEDDKAKKMVKIITLNKDTLQFQMNRSGGLEDVLCLRPLSE